MAALDQEGSLESEPEYQLTLYGPKCFTVLVMPVSIFDEFCEMLNYLNELAIIDTDSNQYTGNVSEAFRLFFNQLNYYEQSYVSVSFYIEDYSPN